MSGKKKKTGLKKATKKAVKKAVRGDFAGGLVGQVVPQVNRAARDLLKELLPSLLAFPTSGASAMASPNLALGGYNSSMALSAPAANGTYVKHNKARLRSNKSGMSIRHREYIQDITFGDAGTFNNIVASPINPGNREMFPWLSGIATRFETYRFNSLRFIYEPQCGTDNEGTAMIAVDFDAVDPPPVDKLQFMTYDGAVRSPPWFASVYACAPYNLHKYKEYYITNSLSTPTSTDEKTYYVGNLYVATQSQSAPFTAGELYVEYECVLSTPQLNSLQQVDGYITSAVRAPAGTYTLTYAEGDLDVMVDYATPNSINNATYLIPAPGGYFVIVAGQAVGDLGSITITLDTSSPPVGVTQASTVALFIENASILGDACIIYGVANTNDPVYFSVSTNSNGIISDAQFNVLILPMDTTILRFLGPFFVPVINPLPGNRLESYLHKLMLRHTATSKSMVKSYVPRALTWHGEGSEKVVCPQKTTVIRPSKH